MPFSTAEIRLLTHALRSPETAPAALQQLRGCHDIAAIEGLVELIFRPQSAKITTAAIATLDGCPHSLVLDALAHALLSEHSSVRLAAASALQERHAVHVDDSVRHLLRHDESWPVRRAALRFLAERPAPIRWSVLDASDDPHWRVRHALVQMLLAWSEDPAQKTEIEERLASAQTTNSSVRREGLLAYLRYRWTGSIAEVPPPPFRFPFPHLWDWDIPVLQRNFERLGDAGRRWALAAMPALLAHTDERIRNIAVDTLRTHGGPHDIAEVIRLCDDLRVGAGESVQKIVRGMHLDRREAIALWIFALPDPSPAQRAWAVEQIGTAIPREEAPPHVLAWQRNASAPVPAPCTDPLLNPLVRAAALTPERAAEVVRDPSQETSWLVLAEAARLAKTPLWKLEPQKPWQPPKATPESSSPLALEYPGPPLPRALGPVPFIVCPLGISGHYGLPVEGFERAWENGVNLMFWEPNYQTMSTFYSRLSPEDRRAIHLIAGTFEAGGAHIRRDVERVLRVLRIEQIAVFLLFWVQTWNRVAPDVREVLQRMKEDGKIATFGLSTHNRALAVEAMQEGWNPVMVRHSVAHRGAEERILPRAMELGTSLITFNNTCYARLLQPHRQMQPPSAADCYRYALSMPGVRACLSAPATVEQLKENLTVLREPRLAEEKRREMLQFGDALYHEETTFRKLVRAL